MSEVKQFKKNIFFSAVSLGTKLIANSLLFFVIAKALFIAPSQFGLLNYALGVGMVFTLLADYGIETYAIRDIASNKINENDFSKIFSYRVLLSFLSFIFFIGYLYFFIKVDQVFTFLIVTSVFIGLLSRTVQLFFQAKEFFHIETSIRVFEDSTLLILTLLNLFVFQDFYLFAYIFLFSRLFGFMISLYFFYKKFNFILMLDFNKEYFINIFKFSFSFALLAILPTLMINLDTMFIREFIDSSIEFINTQISYYSAAIKIMILFTFIASLFQKALLPQLSRISDSKDKLIKHITILNNIITNFNVIFALFIFSYAEDIILLLYDERYIESVNFLKIVSIIIVFRGGVAYGLFYTILDKLKIRIYSSLILLSVFIISSWYFIPIYNGIGALYGISTGYVATWLFLFYMTYKEINDPFLYLNKSFLVFNLVIYINLLKLLLLYNIGLIYVIINISIYFIFSMYILFFHRKFFYE